MEKYPSISISIHFHHFNHHFHPFPWKNGFSITISIHFHGKIVFQSPFPSISMEKLFFNHHFHPFPWKNVFSITISIHFHGKIVFQSPFPSISMEKWFFNHHFHPFQTGVLVSGRLFCGTRKINDPGFLLGPQCPHLRNSALMLALAAVAGAEKKGRKGGGYLHAIPISALTGETILCLRDTAPTRCVRNDRWFQTFFSFFCPENWGNEHHF